jgi:hypothetical protein
MRDWKNAASKGDIEIVLACQHLTIYDQICLI